MIERIYKTILILKLVMLPSLVLAQQDLGLSGTVNVEVEAKIQVPLVVDNVQPVLFGNLVTLESGSYFLAPPGNTEGNNNIANDEQTQFGGFTITGTVGEQINIQFGIATLTDMDGFNPLTFTPEVRNITNNNSEVVDNSNIEIQSGGVELQIGGELNGTEEAGVYATTNPNGQDLVIEIAYII